MTVAAPSRLAVPLLVLLSAAACASRPPAPAGVPGEAPLPEAPAAPASAAPAPRAAAPATCEAFLRPGVLRRGTVVRAVDRGLGKWLQGVKVAPVREAGRFRGWRVESLYPDDPCFRSLDLREGDVVTAVNGTSLERPEQANDVFQSLRSARALRVELVRGANPRTVTLQISD
jgi:type II secretory pathway component PulC